MIIFSRYQEITGKHFLPIKQPPPLPLLFTVGEPPPLLEEPGLLKLLSGTIPSFCEQPNHQNPAGRGKGGSALSI